MSMVGAVMLGVKVKSMEWESVNIDVLSVSMFCFPSGKVSDDLTICVIKHFEIFQLEIKTRMTTSNKNRKCRNFVCVLFGSQLSMTKQGQLIYNK